MAGTGSTRPRGAESCVVGRGASREPGALLRIASPNQCLRGAGAGEGGSGGGLERGEFVSAERLAGDPRCADGAITARSMLAGEAVIAAWERTGSTGAVRLFARDRRTTAVERMRTSSEPIVRAAMSTNVDPDPRPFERAGVGAGGR